VVVSLNDNPVADKVEHSVFSEFRNNMELSIDVPSPLSVVASALVRHVIGVDDIPLLVIFINLLVFSVDLSHFSIGLTIYMDVPFIVSTE
jgi:hypothetical protein